MDLEALQVQDVLARYFFLQLVDNQIIELDHGINGTQQSPYCALVYMCNHHMERLTCRPCSKSFSPFHTNI